MQRIRFTAAALIAICALLAVRPTAAQAPFDAAARVAAIADLLDERTIAIVHADLSQLDLVATAKLVVGKVPADTLGQSNLAQYNAVAGMAGPLRTKLLEAGAIHWYAIAWLTTGGTPAPEPVAGALVVLVAEGKDPRVVAQLLQGFIPFAPTIKGNRIVLTPPGDSHPLTSLRPKPREEFVTALQAAGNTALQVAFVVNEDLRELRLAVSPDLRTAGPAIAGLQRKLQWVALTMNGPPTPALALIVQMEDRESAEFIQAGVKVALESLRKQESIATTVPNLDRLVELLAPKLRGENQLRVVLTEKNGGIADLLDGLAVGIASAKRPQEE